MAQGAAPAPRHAGAHYLKVLAGLHEMLRPRGYLEIGVRTGRSLALARCASIGVDPRFALRENVMAGKPALHLFALTSDDYFAAHDPRTLLPALDLAFVDGTHRAEFVLREIRAIERAAHPGAVIVLHDALPTDLVMARRSDQPPYPPPIQPGEIRVGDVWRLLPLLRRLRPDLVLHALDSPPTGLVLVTRLDPSSRVLWDREPEILAALPGMNLAEIGVEAFWAAQDVRPTADYAGEALLARLPRFPPA
jgi:hypothetical protein